MPNFFAQQFRYTPDVVREILLHTLFESLDGFFQQKTGTGVIDISEGYVQLDTGATIGGLARITKVPYYPIKDAAWTKKRILEATLYISTPGGGNCASYVYSGNVDTPIGFGFGLSNLTLYGRRGNGITGGFTSLEVWGSHPISATRKLKAIFTPGSKVEYYVDGIKKGEGTDYLPTGTSSALYLLWIQNQSVNAGSHVIRVSECRVYQEE